MQADAEGLPALGRRAAVALDHAALQLDGRPHRFDGAGELDQHAVAHRLDDAAVEALDDRRHELGEMRPQVVERPLLVGAHQAAVAGDVGEQDGRQPAVGRLVGHAASPLHDPMEDDLVCHRARSSVGDGDCIQRQ